MGKAIYAYMKAGGIWEGNLYFLLNFTVNLKLILKSPLSFPEYHQLLIFGSLEKVN